MEKAVQIEIHTHDRNLLFDLLEKAEVSKDDEIRIYDIAKLKYGGSYIRKAIGFPEIVYFVLTFTTSVSASQIAKLKIN